MNKNIKPNSFNKPNHNPFILLKNRNRGTYKKYFTCDCSKNDEYIYNLLILLKIISMQ